METRSLRTRVANACDLCKLRKIKCSGAQPCAYCVRRREPESCRYTAPRRRPRPRSDGIAVPVAAPSNRASPSSSTHSVPTILVRHEPDPSSHHSTPTPSFLNPTTQTPGASLAPAGPDAQPEPHPRPPQQQHSALAALEEHEETEVPREARLVCDAQGKLVFIGDCAPLSFFQTVRRLVTTRVDAGAFAPGTSGYSALENAYARSGLAGGRGGPPPGVKGPVGPAVAAYLEVTAGLVDLFDDAVLERDVTAWAERSAPANGGGVDLASAVNYLVLAIGCQKSDGDTAQAYFDYARSVAFASLGGNLGVASVQVFILVAFYSLCACQINGAFLFFGIAARAAYSIGIHRAAVNARFGPDVHRQRDRLWKSLRVLDLFLSTSMGRPPATSDVDCTVPYRAQDEAGQERFDLLNASAQIFLIIEAVVMEVYSRRKISPRLTEGISRELRDWSGRWLQRLKDVVDGTVPESQPGMASGACQILSTYYYAVILVSRPFLMVELHRRLADESGAAGAGLSGKSKLADACIDAAILMVELVQSLVERGQMTRRAPVVVSWLFASSLVLGVGLLGGFGRILEKHCRASIAALEYLAQADAHAVQYSLIAKSLLATALQYLERREMQERRQRTESSSQLFGLIPRTSRGTMAGSGDRGVSNDWKGEELQSGHGGLDSAQPGRVDDADPRFNFDFEATFLGLDDAMLFRMPELPLAGGPLDADSEQTLGALNLFPLLETDGHIDLANYF